MRIFTVLLLLLLLLGCSQLKQAEDDNIWRIASLEWPPYAGKDLPQQGHAIAALRRLLAQHDIALEVEFHQWSYSQKLARSDDYIGYYPAWPEEVKDGFFASLPIEWSLLGVVQFEENRRQYSDLSELFAQHRVGLVADYVYPEWVNKLANDATLYARDEAHLARLLESKTIDAALTDPFVFSEYAKRLNLGKIYADILEEKPLVLAVSDTAKNRVKLKILRQIEVQQ
ncbi:hypothetical protein [Bermanella sp. R86510]|uniref:hypothetical protein n=1 Tax=unclassified Bermanella TaxID=2627862 RepID=UPI0037C7E05E